MTTETDTTSEVARSADVLTDHPDWYVKGESTHDAMVFGCQGCTAEVWRDLSASDAGDLTQPRAAFAKHQAAMLAEAGLLRDERDSAEPCDAETWSMDHYRDGQVDPYWIRCNALGPHDEHEDANTGLTWTTDDPEEAQIAAPVPAGEAHATSGGRGASGGLDGAPVDSWPFAPGDVVHSNGPTTDAEWLDDAPVGTVVRDSDSVLWTRRVETDRLPYHWAAPRGLNLVISSLLVHRGPMTVVSIGKEPT